MRLGDTLMRSSAMEDQGWDRGFGHSGWNLLESREVNAEREW